MSDTSLRTETRDAASPAELARHLAGAPFIYGLAAPLALLDVCVSLYQAVCFRLWDVPRVRRRNYVTFRRAELPYLDVMQRVNCGYCSYANGVLAYAQEIAARTEQYWCPIKHPAPPPVTHERYARFVPYGDPLQVRERMRDLRDDLQADAD